MRTLSSTSTLYRCRRPLLPRLPLLLVLFLPASTWTPLTRLLATAAATASPAPGSVPLKITTAAQLVAAIRDDTVPEVYLAVNLRIDPAIWPPAAPIGKPLLRAANFTVRGADWLPILDLAFVESKVQLQPGVIFRIVQVEIRNVRTRAGFELDVFARSPGAVVRYEDSVYHCFSCLPLASLANALYSITPASLPHQVEAVSWTRPQEALQETYSSPDRAMLFRTASTVLMPSGVPGATSGGGYELQAVHTVLACEEPIDPTACETSRGIEYCVSSKIDAMAARDDTWERLAMEARLSADSRGEVGGGGGGAEPERSGLSLGAAVGGAVGGALGLAAVIASATTLYVIQRRRRRKSNRGGAAVAVAVAASDLAVLSDSETPQPPASEPMTVKIVMTEEGDDDEEGGGGKDGKKGGGGGSNCKQVPQPASTDRQSSSGNESEAPGRTQVAMCASVATAIAAAAPAASQSHPQRLPQPHALPPYSPGAANGAPAAVVAAAAANGSMSAQLGSITFPGLTAALANVPMSLTTLGESFQRLSSQEACQEASQSLNVEQRPGRSAPAAPPGTHPPLPVPLPLSGGGLSATLRLEDRLQQPVVVVAGITIELMSAIGTGSFGKVFRGSWQGRPVAVKVLQYGAELSRAVHNEVLLSQTLRHPNVVAALYFAQVLPGGRLGLHTSGGLPPQPAPQPQASTQSHEHGAAAAAGAPGSAGGGRNPATVEAGCYSRFIVSGALPGSETMNAAQAVGAVTGEAAVARLRAAAGGAGGGGLAAEPPNANSATETLDAAVARAAALLPRRRRRGSTSSTSLPLPGVTDAAALDAHPHDPHHRQQQQQQRGGGGSQTGSAPLSWMRHSDMCVGEAGAALCGDDGDDDADGDDNSSRSDGEPDVLSRWDEQRRRQQLVERVGAKLIGPELVVSSNGYLQRAATAVGIGSDGASKPNSTTAAPSVQSSGDRAAAAAAAAAVPPLPDSTPCSGTTAGPPPAPSAPTKRQASTVGPSTAADAAAAAALPMQALWLAAHAQPAEGASHGFLVMELCEGGSAFAWRRGAHWSAAAQGPDLGVLLRLALDIAYGMSYIHSMGICHGDLKLSNVLLARSSDAAALACGSSPNDLLAGWVAKVCDFGLSRVLTGDRTHVSTRPYGTPTHMAPELWTKGHMSQPADVYAFGITLWELATGERPYKGLTAARILHRVLLNGGRPALPLWLPPSYTRLMALCWAQSPKDRPTFGDIVRHLEAMLAVLAAVTSKG